MLRALYSGISGMKVNQQKLDVIGNNIANVGTTGFKGSRTRFQDMLSQSVTEAKGSSTNQGGVNPSQIGLGVKMAGVDTIMNQGSMQPTSNTLDVAIDGDGYFMVAKGPVINGTTVTVDNTNTNTTGHTVTSAGGLEMMYTRDGSFTLDDNGNLLNSDGLRVLGYSLNDGTNESIDATTQGKLNYCNPDAAAFKASDTLLKTLIIPDTVSKTTAGVTSQVRIRSVSIGKDGLITGVLEDGTSTAIGQIAMASFKNPEGLKKLGGNLNEATANSGVAVLRTGTHTAGAADNSKGYGDQLQGMLEMSNVDLSEQFTDMIVSTRAFEASGKIITTGDEILQTIIGLKR